MLRGRWLSALELHHCKLMVVEGMISMQAQEGSTILEPTATSQQEFGVEHSTQATKFPERPPQ